MNKSLLAKAAALSGAYFTAFMLYTVPIMAHCDTMDGPVVADAKTAFEKNNVNYVLKWVKSEYENEITNTFQQVIKVRALNSDAKELAEKYFYDLLVRLHRSGEGVPFTGVKPTGTPVDEKIKAADLSVEKGDFGVVEKIVPKERSAHARDLFDRAMKLKSFNVDDVKAGREYVEAYVQYFHFIEGGEEVHIHKGGEHADENHSDHAAHIDPIVRILSLVFFMTTILFSVLYFKAIKKNS